MNEHQNPPAQPGTRDLTALEFEFEVDYTMPSTPAARNSADEQPSLLVPQERLRADLEDRIARGEQLKSRQVGTPEALEELRNDYFTWDEYNVTLLRRSFSTSALADDYSGVVFAVGAPGTLGEEYRALVADVAGSIRRLRSIEERLPLYSEVGPAPETRRLGASHTGQDIFIVHGHNEAVRQSVARFITQVTGREPIILHEQANAGRTIIEKFEDYADSAGFAVVLLTADDEGGKRGSGDNHLRARQNVILELGFFIGTLGRKRVAALYESGVELPSDISGMLYTSLDADWRIELGREMRSAAIEVDLNKAL